MQQAVAVGEAPPPHIRQVPIDRAWQWLGAGWRDLMAVPVPSCGCGLLVVAAGWLALLLLIGFDLPYLVVPLGAGFFFLGPFVATGLYEISRRRERGMTSDFRSTFLAWRRNPDQLALMGLFLLVFHLAWMRFAQLLFAVFEWRTVPSWDRFADLVWFSSRSLPFLAVGVAFGAVLAALAFLVGAFSIPYLLDRRQSNLFEAIATSVAAVRHNLRPMLLWATLIVVLVGVAMVPGLLGLAVVLPVVGHATWHAYRDVVSFADHEPVA